MNSFAFNSMQRWQQSRRHFLQFSTGTGLSFLLPTLSTQAAEKRGVERPKSLLTLWMAGGPSQLETFDPHPQGRNVGETAAAIKTKVPGLEISSLLPRLAEQMHHVSVIRSLVSKEGDHERGTYFVQTGYRPDPSVVHPAITAVASKFLSDSKLEIPAHVALAEGDRFTVPRGGYLGAEYDAFRVQDPGRNLQNMQARVDEPRLQRRLDGLETITQVFREGRSFEVDRTQHAQVIDQARIMMNSEQLRAFSIDEEPQSVREKYGDTRFGRGCLVARRLLEQGVRAIQVTLPGFDTHANNYGGHVRQTEILDPAFATLLQELTERDLLDSTIVLCIGEFGRTPWLNPLDGRDHWPSGFSCVLGGGGIVAGKVLGETDPDAAFSESDKKRRNPLMPKDPVSIPDLYATILTLLDLNPSDEIHTPIGRPIRLSEGSPLSRLIPSIR